MTIFLISLTSVKFGVIIDNVKFILFSETP